MKIEDTFNDSNPEHIACIFLRGPIRNAEISQSRAAAPTRTRLPFISHRSYGSDQDGEFKDHFAYPPCHISKSFCQ